MFDKQILALAQQVVTLCTEKNVMVATAESCTGGLVAGAITEIPGSSQVLERGFVTYSDQAKSEMLGVMSITLKQYGAVSKDTALEMAHGALSRSEAGISVSITGIAGPGGGSTGKPVGLVHFGGRHYKGAMIHRQMNFGDIGRDEIRLASVEIALEMIIELAKLG
ncbi:CinA family protein [Rhizobium sp. KVB221]|uniref:CinA family protein n=2 Tax=Rhizobium setariae TaxID=2801340 RepID=A0A936YQM8_9HYPH|nr:CinA family protein [Rhizobium setariae]MBL0373908.1 CinA family protein [Rhizobium setariae]